MIYQIQMTQQLIFCYKSQYFGYFLVDALRGQQYIFLNRKG